jgi:beta-xylosidase
MKKFKTLALLMFASVTGIQAQEVNPFGNPVVPDMTADASIILVDDTFYYYATTDGYGRHLETSGPPVVWKSKDFVNWSFDGNYFPSAAEQKYWAPSKAIAANGKWYIYPTINGYMYPAVADSPEGPFRLARGEDKFELPYSEGSTLLQGENRGGIDVEVFIDDDGKAYIFWGMRHVARLQSDMITLDSITTLNTRRGEYSEGPIFFKRNGIYYYLYTIGGDEKYEYYYQMSKESPLGSWETPQEDLISTTNIQTGVFGPGHGCVFNVEGTDDYYFAYLEFGRNSTNRQTYVNKLEFNEDGTIQQVKVDMNGIGALRQIAPEKPLKVVKHYASSSKAPLKIRHFKDSRCQRTEFFDPSFAFDNANGSRWMAAEGDTLQTWMVADLGVVKPIKRSELYFVRPTAGHAYTLEGSTDGINWEKCGGHDNIEKRSPHTDILDKQYRYLRVSIQDGIAGIWEWKMY